MSVNSIIFQNKMLTRRNAFAWIWMGWSGRIWWKIIKLQKTECTWGGKSKDRNETCCSIFRPNVKYRSLSHNIQLEKKNWELKEEQRGALSCGKIVFGLTNHGTLDASRMTKAVTPTTRARHHLNINTHLRLFFSIKLRFVAN